MASEVEHKREQFIGNLYECGSCGRVIVEFPDGKRFNAEGMLFATTTPHFDVVKEQMRLIS